MAHAAVAPAPAPTANIAPQRITLAPVGTFSDTEAKLTILSIGTTPLPQNTLQGAGQGIYVNNHA